MKKTYRVLCVCLGNICRSPTAEVILRDACQKAGLAVEVDSAGTSNYHPGEAPDHRSQQCAARHGYDLSALRARQIRLDDFCHFDLILAMDEENLRDLRYLQQKAQQQWHNQSLAQVALMSEHDPHYHKQAIPDPYYGTARDFERVIEQCRSASQAWIAYWQQQHII